MTHQGELEAGQQEPLTMKGQLLQARRKARPEAFVWVWRPCNLRPSDVDRWREIEVRGRERNHGWHQGS